MKGPVVFKSIVDLMSNLNSDAECRSFLKSLLWKQDSPPGCPRCGNMAIYIFKDGKTYKCASCLKKFNILTGTVFENTKLPLQKWIACIWISMSFKRGVSSYQVARNIGVTQKTAWFMMQKIRTLFGKLRADALEGVCTADETYVGGKQKNKHKSKRVKGQQGRGSSEKINVIGVMQLGGKVVTQVAADVSRATLIPFIQKHVVPGSTMMTDEWKGYNGLNQNYVHQVCDHGKYQYVSDSRATTNPIENYWSHVKRSVIGTYYHISKKHITRYLSEFDFKFNYRDISDGERFTLVLSHAYNTRITYGQLQQG